MKFKTKTEKNTTVRLHACIYILNMYYLFFQSSLDTAGHANVGQLVWDYLFILSMQKKSEHRKQNTWNSNRNDCYFINSLTMETTEMEERNNVCMCVLNYCISFPHSLCFDQSNEGPLSIFHYITVHISKNFKIV